MKNDRACFTWDSRASPLDTDRASHHHEQQTICNVLLLDQVSSTSILDVLLIKHDFCLYGQWNIATIKILFTQGRWQSFLLHFS